ncbi:uncharacterized protein LOC106166527, partial [Lingula anatina]|uniref:Uncharacterized protein LOC106166527 n=1 Tax=Lingula anatina TaxID=7574 RepID=A0A1S3IR77_LINAN
MNTSILSVLILVILVGVNCGFRPRGSFHSDDGGWDPDNWMKWIRNSERRDHERGNRGNRGEQPGELDEDELAPELFIPTIEPLPSTSEPDVNFNIKVGGLNLGWDGIFSQSEGKWPKFFRRIFSGPPKPWWKGPNVCVTREERNETVPGIVTHHRVFANSYCDETETSYKCTTDITVYGIKRSFVVTYECCHGFEKPAGASGCTKKLVLKNLVETARDLDSDEFLRAVDSVGLTDTLKVENLTLFVPTNEAIKAYLEKDSQKLLPGVILVDGTLAEMASDLRAVLEGHVVPGFLKSSNFTDENLISTVLPPVKLRTNLYDVPRR